MVQMDKRNYAFGVLIAALIALAALGGCTAPQSDSASLQKLSALQESFGVKNAYSSNPAQMNDYISGLSELRAKSGGSSAKIIDAELSSAQAFYYLSLALGASNEIDYQSVSCNSKQVSSAVEYDKLALTASTRAISFVSLLSAEELKSMRANQLDMVKSYKASAEQIKSFIASSCGN